MACAVADDAVLCTDGSGLLASVAQALDIEHQPVNAEPHRVTRRPVGLSQAGLA
jgi:hypothetical protein